MYMYSLYGFILLFVFLDLFSSHDNNLNEDANWSKYDELNKQWVSIFKEYTNPYLADTIINNPYNPSFSPTVQWHAFQAMRASKILEQHKSTLNNDDKSVFKNIFGYNRFWVDFYVKLELKNQLDYINASQGMIREVVINQRNVDVLSKTTQATDNTDTSDISSGSSNYSSLSDSTVSQSVGSFFQSRNQLKRAQQLKEESDKAYFATQQAQDREKKALEVLDSNRRERLQRLENVKKVELWISKFQAGWKGYKVRKDLAGIQQQLMYEKEQKNSINLQKCQTSQKQEEIEARDKKILQQQVLLDQQQEKNRREKKKAKNKLNKNKWETIKKQLLREQRATEVEQQQAKIAQQNSSFKDLKQFGVNLPEDMSLEDFQEQLIAHIKQSIKNLPLDDNVKNNIAIRTIYNSAVDLSQQAFNQQLSALNKFNTKQVFNEIVNPTCDNEMKEALKKSAWGRQLSSTDIDYLMKVKKESFYATLHWMHKHLRLQEK